MASSQRTTVYLSPQLYRALKVKAATTDRGLSELINEAVRLALREDALDEEAFRSRAKEPSRAFSQVLRDLKRARAL
jgi:ribbon-helix-helix CopG family protein